MHSIRNSKHTLRTQLRRGFNLVELLLALAITAALLTSVMVALHASFMAYQSTTEVASTHTIGRLTINRILALIRTGTDFQPLPASPLDPVVFSNNIEFTHTSENGTEQTIILRWDEPSESLFVGVGPDPLNITEHLLLEGVIAQEDADGNPISPFTLEYEKGVHLHRATVDLAVRPDDNMSVELDGNNFEIIRLVASAMPRMAAY